MGKRKREKKAAEVSQTTAAVDNVVADLGAEASMANSIGIGGDAPSVFESEPLPQSAVMVVEEGQVGDNIVQQPEAVGALTPSTQGPAIVEKEKKKRRRHADGGVGDGGDGDGQRREKEKKEKKRKKIDKDTG